MIFACQKDCYKKEFLAVVKSCASASRTIVIDNKKKTVEGYEVTLNDTILFPEGGGQPTDTGWINEIPVYQVSRANGEAVHFTESPLEPGIDVELKVDWSRRFDHMQHHTGQHLITAVAERMFNYKTTSWWLGEKNSFIELDTNKLTVSEVLSIEENVNRYIRDAVEVEVHVYDSKDDPELELFRCRGLPKDHQGPVRVIKIGELDHNLCCGTHVSNLSQLQIIKLLQIEKGKRNATNLYFEVGNRVLSHLQKSLNVERSLNNILSGEDHPGLAEKLVKSSKELRKINLQLLRELAEMHVSLFKALPENGNFLSIHRKSGEMDFINAALNAINDENVVVFITIGDTSGLFFIRGPQDFLSVTQSRITELLEVKGACKNGRFQGRANRLSQKNAAEAFLRDTLKNFER